MRFGKLGYEETCQRIINIGFGLNRNLHFNKEKYYDSYRSRKVLQL